MAISGRDISNYERFKIQITGRIKRVKRRCWFSHDFDKWRDIAKGDIRRRKDTSSDWCVVGYFVRQQRRCLTCGRLEMRDVNSQ